MLFCDPQEDYGGGRLCAEDGSWAEVLPPHSSILGCGCHMSESCLWQTCRYGNSSQEWSVNCGLEDAGCLAAVAGAGLEAECDEFTGAGDCLLGCEVDILLLLLSLLYYNLQYSRAATTPSAPSARTPGSRAATRSQPPTSTRVQTSPGQGTTAGCSTVTGRPCRAGRAPGRRPGIPSNSNIHIFLTRCAH